MSLASMAKDPEIAKHYLAKLRNSTSLAYRRKKVTDLLKDKINQEGSVYILKVSQSTHTCLGIILGLTKI
jgi:hypothetical protein